MDISQTSLRRKRHNEQQRNAINTERVEDIPAAARNQKFFFKAQKIPNRDLEHNILILS